MASRGYKSLDTTSAYCDNSYPGDHMVWDQLITSTDGVRKRVVLALSEFFVLSLSGLDFNWRSQAVAAWWDMLAANALGNYRPLLEGVTLSPAMGYYLNTRGNLKADVARGPAGRSQNGFGKLREPMVWFIQWGRTFGLTSARGNWKIGDLSNPATQLGQSPLRPPSVFNFSRPGYVPPPSWCAA